MRNSNDSDFSALAKVRSMHHLIGLAEPVLTRNGDIIARLTGLSRLWIGLGYG